MDCMLLMSGRMSADLYFILINTLCTPAPGFSRDYVQPLSICNELYFPIIRYSNSMRAAIFLIMGKDYLSLVDV